jgi:cyclic pyranopterin monophosphate synthase
MVDITEKNNTLRVAKARATVQVSSEETIQAIHSNQVPKGNVFEMSKAAGLLGVKNTPLILIDCHPIPIESTQIEYIVEGLQIHVDMTVKTIYKTGVEVEAMHGASVVALNMYDMLKPLDKGVTIESIRLLSKKGGKSDFNFNPDVKTLIVVCSDSISRGNGEDRSGKALQSFLIEKGVEKVDYRVISDDVLEIKNSLASNYDWIIFTGGTGISNRDNTHETLANHIDKRLYGVEEQMRGFGQARNPKAMFSRSIAGVKGQQLLLGLPGSRNGAMESLKSIFPYILHTFDVLGNNKCQNA